MAEGRKERAAELKPGDKVRIGGVEATIGTPGQCEAAEAYVCIRKGVFSPFADNLEAPCSVCGETVLFRPYAPAAPPKICTVCLFELLAATKQ